MAFLEIKQLPFQECLLWVGTFQAEIPDRVTLTQCSPHCSHVVLFAILLLSESSLPFCVHVSLGLIQKKAPCSCL